MVPARCSLPCVLCLLALAVRWCTHTSQAWRSTGAQRSSSKLCWVDHMGCVRRLLLSVAHHSNAAMWPSVQGVCTALLIGLMFVEQCNPLPA